MEAKEKAKELVEKYQFNGDMVDDIRMSEEFALECALICISEIIKERKVLNNDFDRERISKLEEVIREINKL